MKAKTAWMALAAAVVAFLGTNEAQAYTQTINGITWTYSITSGTATVEKGSQKSGDIVIPPKLGGYTVTRIDAGAFSVCSKLTAVVIPDTVTRIGDYAFDGCTQLTKVTMPKQLKSIGTHAFCTCPSLVSRMAIPVGVTNIGDYAFNDCSGLKTLTLPHGLKDIGDVAFAGCSGLTAVTIPGSVTNIGISAFYGCSGLKTATFSFGVKNIERSAFEKCSGLTAITISGSVTNIGESAFYGCSGLKTVTIPGSVKSIGGSAFEGCSGLKTATISFGVKDIGSHAFDNCSSLTTVTIPGSVTNIGDSAFYGCRSLTTATFSFGVKDIGYYAFENCSALTTVTISGSVTNIGGFAFAGCNGLKTATIPGSVAGIRRSVFERCTGLKTLYVPASWEGTDKVPRVPDGCTVVYKPSKVVEFNGAGGICSGRWLSVLEGCEYGGLPTATRAGWTFGGWWTGPNGTGFRVLPTSRVQSTHRTLHAFWVKPTYTVAYSGMGGAGKMAAQPMKYGTAAALRANAFRRAGYVFAGWSRSKWGAVEFANGATVKNLSTTGGTVTLYAQWAKPTYTVAFNGMGGVGAMAPQPMRYGAALLLKWNAFMRPGFRFAGWSTQPWGAVVYANRASVKNLARNGGTVTLYAVWRAQPVAHAAKAKSAAARAAVAATTSDGSDGSAAADGDEGTAWVVDAEEGAWVVLSFAEAREVASVEVAGENLPAGMRVLLSEDAEEWVEGDGGTARYVWVAFPEGSGVVAVREVRVGEE